MTCVEPKTKKRVLSQEEVEQYMAKYAQSWPKRHEATANFYQEQAWCRLQQQYYYYYTPWMYQSTDIFFDKRN